MGALRCRHVYYYYCFSNTPGTSRQSKLLPVIVLPSVVMCPHAENEEHCTKKNLAQYLWLLNSRTVGPVRETVYLLYRRFNYDFFTKYNYLSINLGYGRRSSCGWYYDRKYQYSVQYLAAKPFHLIALSFWSFLSPIFLLRIYDFFINISNIFISCL
jgi:hypothetical protein